MRGAWLRLLDSAHSAADFEVNTEPMTRQTMRSESHEIEEYTALKHH
jgi:hypothetical protein